ncbi:unnamed protein product, partial [Discosporangium mesarthrocarpum]
GNGCDQGICGFGNEEAQWYRGENAWVQDGNLVLVARHERHESNVFTSAKARRELR